MPCLPVSSVGDLLTLKHASALLGVSYMRVWRYVRNSQVPTIKIGNTLLVRYSDLAGIRQA